jgi:hypothetical protein
VFIDSRFTLNHLFTQWKAVTILVWKSLKLGLFTIMLISSANNICIVWYTPECYKLGLFLHTSENPIIVKGFFWMRALNSHWSEKKSAVLICFTVKDLNLNGKHRILFCHLGLKVYWCQAIALTPRGKLWALHLVPTQFRKQSTRILLPLSVPHRVFDP